MTRISLVIPTYNDSHFLLEAVGSVAEQEPIEIVVVDDGSDDAQALEVLDGLRRSGSTVVRRPNGGPSAARNTGISATTGRYVHFLDSDDVLVPGALGRLGDLLDAHPQVGYAWGDYVEFGASEGRCRTPARVLPWTMTYMNLLHPCCMFRRSSLATAGGWPEMGYEDWALLLALQERGIDGMSSGDVVYRRRIHGQGRNLAADRRRHGEVYAELQRRHPAVFRRRPEWKAIEKPAVWKQVAYPALWGSRRILPPDAEDWLRSSALWKRLKPLRS